MKMETTQKKDLPVSIPSNLYQLILDSFFSKWVDRRDSKGRKELRVFGMHDTIWRKLDLGSAYWKDFNKLYGQIVEQAEVLSEMGLIERVERAGNRNNLYVMPVSTEKDLISRFSLPAVFFYNPQVNLIANSRKKINAALDEQLDIVLSACGEASPLTDAVYYEHSKRVGATKPCTPIQARLLNFNNQYEVI